MYTHACLRVHTRVYVYRCAAHMHSLTAEGTMRGVNMATIWGL